MPTDVPPGMCECVAAAGLCEETCDAYVPALSNSEACMDAFVNVVCGEGVEGSFFDTPYYMLCPNVCLGDCSLEANDESTITCLKRRVDVLALELDLTAQDVDNLEDTCSNTCSATLEDISEIVERGCSTNEAQD